MKTYVIELGGQKGKVFSGSYTISSLIKEKFYNTIIASTMLHGSKCWIIKEGSRTHDNHGDEDEDATEELGMCATTWRDKVRNKYIKNCTNQKHVKRSWACPTENRHSFDKGLRFF